MSPGARRLRCSCCRRDGLTGRSSRGCQVPASIHVSSVNLTLRSCFPLQPADLDWRSTWPKAKQTFKLPFQIWVLAEKHVQRGTGWEHFPEDQKMGPEFLGQRLLVRSWLSQKKRILHCLWPAGEIQETLLLEAVREGAVPLCSAKLEPDLCRELTFCSPLFKHVLGKQDLVIVTSYVGASSGVPMGMKTSSQPWLKEHCFKSSVSLRLPSGPARWVSDMFSLVLWKPYLKSPR